MTYCFFNFNNFLITHESYKFTPAVVNSCGQIRPHLTIVVSQLQLTAVVSSIVILRVSIEKIKKSRLIRNTTKLCTSSMCIFIEVSLKFRSIQTKSRFNLIFRPSRTKSQFFSKCESENVT